ncbi:MAG TPA: hypothetical protein VL171_12565 [Verrucomicrobiae bacterium]|nr:hypothetical protein [Verrucomicrobiae bacterium]
MDKGAANPSWMSVDFIAKIDRKEKGFVSAWPFQAIQVWSLRHYPPPPFAITKKFRTAFNAAVREYGIDRVKNLRTTRPPKPLLEIIVKKMKK